MIPLICVTGIIMYYIIFLCQLKKIAIKLYYSGNSKKSMFGTEELFLVAISIYHKYEETPN